MTQEITDLLETTGATAAEMTHELCILGGGNMEDGMKLLWQDGHECGLFEGAVISTVVLASGYIISRIATRRKRKQKQIDIIGEAFAAGVASGKRRMEYLRHPFPEEEDRVSFAPGF